MRADGSGQKQLTAGPEVDSRPLVSPNGRYVVFERRDRRRRAARPLHGQRRRRHALTRSRPPRRRARRSFSPDGRTIAFVRSTETPAAAPRTTSTRCARPARAAPLDPHPRPRRVAPRGLERDDRLQPRQERRRLERLRRHLLDGQNGKHVKQADRRRRLGLRRGRDRQRPHDPLPPRPGSLGEADRRQGAQARRTSRQSRTNSVFSSDGSRSPPSPKPTNSSRSR